jgi:hypothetical protein
VTFSRIATSTALMGRAVRTLMSCDEQDDDVLESSVIGHSVSSDRDLCVHVGHQSGPTN